MQHDDRRGMFDALCDGFDEPEMENLRPILLLADFLGSLKREDIAALLYGDDIDRFDLLGDVEQKGRGSAALADAPLPPLAAEQATTEGALHPYAVNRAGDGRLR